MHPTKQSYSPNPILNSDIENSVFCGGLPPQKNAILYILETNVKNEQLPANVSEWRWFAQVVRYKD